MTDADMTDADMVDVATGYLRYPFTWPGPVTPPTELLHLRDEPVVRATVPSGDTVTLVTRYRDVRAVLSDARVSKNLSRPDAARYTTFDVFQHEKIPMDPPEYNRVRRSLTRAFSVSRVERLRPHVRALVTQILDSLADETSPVNLITAVGLPLSRRVICDMLGVPLDSQGLFGDLRNLDAWHYLPELLALKRAEPRDDLVSELIQIADTEGTISGFEVAYWSMILLHAGYETTAAILGASVVMLSAHPEQFALLKERIELLPRAIEELMRCQIVGSSLLLMRYVTEDIEVGGVAVPRGTSMIPVLESANRDASVFPDPHVFDITRTENPHLTFSVGTHFCMGAALARLVVRTAFEELLTRFPNFRLAVPIDELSRNGDPILPSFTEVPVSW